MNDIYHSALLLYIFLSQLDRKSICDTDIRHNRKINLTIYCIYLLQAHERALLYIELSILNKK